MYKRQGIRERAGNFRYNILAPLFSLNLNLREAPRYQAAERQPELDRAFMVIMGLDDVAQYPEIVRHHEQGTIPPTVMWGSCPTVFDPSQAPAGCHTAFMWEKLPYRLNGDARNWDRERERHGRKMLQLWQRHAPNLEGAVISSFTRSALDVERCFPNMREGDLLVGALSGPTFASSASLPCENKGWISVSAGCRPKGVPVFAGWIASNCACAMLSPEFPGRARVYCA